MHNFWRNWKLLTSYAQPSIVVPQVRDINFQRNYMYFSRICDLKSFIKVAFEPRAWMTSFGDGNTLTIWATKAPNLLHIHQSIPLKTATRTIQTFTHLYKILASQKHSHNLIRISPLQWDKTHESLVSHPIAWPIHKSKSHCFVPSKAYQVITAQ
jgi:hypothetical protein